MLDDGCTAVLLLVARLIHQTAGGNGDAAHATDGMQQPAPPPPVATVDTTSQDGHAAAGPSESTTSAAQHPRLGAYELSGEATLGGRLIHVSGSSAQFAEDQNLERGLFLRDFELSGVRVADQGAEGGAAPRSFTLQAFGLGTRDAGAKAALSSAGVDLGARYERTLYSGTTGSDVHAFDFERERGSLSLTHDDRNDTVRRAGVELTWGHRDAFVNSSRSVGFGSVSDVPVERDERRLGGDGQLTLGAGELELELRAGLEELTADDQRSFTAPHPIFPQSEVSEDFAADTGGHTRNGSVRLRRAHVTSELDADAGVSWRATHMDGNSDAHQTGIENDPDLPFVSDTHGDAEFDGQAFTADAGLAWKLAADTDVDLRFTHEREREDGSLLQTVTLDEFTGDPPTISTFLDTVQESSVLELFETRLRTPLADSLDLELSLAAGQEQIEVNNVSDGSTLRLFDGKVDVFSGECRLSADTGHATQIELAAGSGVLPTESSHIGVLFTFEDTRTSFGSLGWHWHPRESTALGAEARYEERTSEAFDSHDTSAAFSFSGSTRLGRSMTLDGALTYRTFDLVADTTFITLDPAPTEIPGQVSFAGIQRIVTAGTTCEVSEALHPRLWLSATNGTGDGSFEYEAFDLDVPLRLSERLEIGSNASWVHFDGDAQLESRNYDAGILVLYARVSF